MARWKREQLGGGIAGWSMVLGDREAVISNQGRGVWAAGVGDLQATFPTLTDAKAWCEATLTAL